MKRLVFVAAWASTWIVAGCGGDSPTDGGEDLAERPDYRPYTCANNVKDGDETDLDCGGSCPGCAIGLACLQGKDCAEKVCTSDRCAAPTCTDGVLNGQESGVDCGGGKCPLCPLGEGCFQGSDCTSGYCLNNLCSSMDDLAVADAPPVDAGSSDMAGCPVLHITPDPLGSCGKASAVRLENDCASDIQVVAVQLGGADPGDFQLQNVPQTPFTVPASSGIDFQVVYTAMGMTLSSASVFAASSDMQASANTPLYGGPGPLGTLDMASLGFGTVMIGKLAAPQAVTITNGGGCELHISSIVATGANPVDFPVDLTGTAFVVPPQGSTTFHVGFAPTATGARAAQVTVSSSDYLQPMRTVDLSGSGS